MNFNAPAVHSKLGILVLSPLMVQREAEKADVVLRLHTTWVKY